MRSIFFIVIFFGLAACGSVPTKNVVETTNETFQHKSGMFSFPVYLAGLVRGTVSEFDSGSMDVGASYRLADNSLLITVYAFPAPPLSDGTTSSLMDHHYYEESAIIEKTPETLKIGWPDTIPMWSDEGVSGALSAYDLAGKGEKVSLLQLYDYGKWRLKFRTTYLAVDSAEASIKIDQFHKEYNWPK